MLKNLIYAVLLAVIAQARQHPVRAAKLKANPDKDMVDPWVVKSFDVKLDHFDYTDTRKFPMRWLWNNTFYKPGGPIFFCTGNQGDIEIFAESTGIIWDLAPMFNAAIIFAEHRYYGDSEPFGSTTFSKFTNLGFLSSEQVLADYAELLHELKTPKNTFDYSYPKDTPVIAFGGSYGGMLSTWLRIKYPHLIDGAWSASAALLSFRGGGVDQGTFYSLMTKTYVDVGCNRNLIANSWNAILNLSSTDEGRDFLNTRLRIDPISQIKTKEDGWNLNYYLREAIKYMAMMNYPYEADFFEHLPQWPVKVACSFLNDSGTNFSDEELATRIFNAANVYYNGSGSLRYHCIDLVKCGHQATTMLFNSKLAWPWQDCSEIIIDMCAKGGQNDFFWDECKSSLQDLAVSSCTPIFKSFDWSTANWNVDTVPTLYGLTLKYASNIILTQGQLDPWSVGGYKASSPGIRNDHGVYVIEIPGAAHHLDLRTPNTCDPNTVTNARYQIVQIIKCWVQSCSTSVQLKDLPELKIPPKGTECEDINYGYPWGQKSSGIS